MPQKQMAIEAEFNSGAINADEMKRRKEEIEREKNFYGAMDGASKFISGNVKIGIFITVVNVVAGIIVGVALHGEPFSQALSTYISFSIGDGLLSQFPALLISTATGIIVTRSVATGTFAEDISDEFSKHPQIYWIGAAVLLVLAFIPGFPWYVLVPMALLLAFTAFRLGRDLKRKAAAGGSGGAIEQKKEDSGDLSPIVPLDPLSLELGYGLIPLVDKDKGAELLERVQHLRRESALELGLVIPRVRIIDNMALDPSEYCFKIKGVEVGRGKIRMSYYLCINPGGAAREDIPGERTVDPTFGLPAIWVSEEYRDEAERAGYTVVDPPSIIATHLSEIIKHHASELLGRQETQKILDTLKTEYPAVVEEALSSAVPNGAPRLTLGDIQKVLQGLLHEEVSIRNMVTILEACADYAEVAKKTLGNPIQFLVEKARQALGRQICLQYADDKHALHCLTIEHSLEQKIIDSGVQTSSGAVAAMEPALYAQWIQALSRSIVVMKEQGWVPPVVLCSEGARALVKQSAEREVPELVVLSVREIVQDVNIAAIGEIRLPEAVSYPR
jgi:flagellar biosynthesis protein FlhA